MIQSPSAWIWVALLSGLLFCNSCDAVNADFRMANRWMNSVLFPPDVEGSGSATLSGNSEDAMSAWENRLIIDGTLYRSLDFSAHVLTTMDYSTRAGMSLPGVTLSGRPGGFYRHPDLEWEWRKIDNESDRLAGTTALDRLMVEWRSASTTVTVGRQAIGLSSCFFLTINDFFEPLAAEAVYREYKPGVDAVSVRHYLGSLSEIDLISVAGYDPDSDVDWDESALIARSVFTVGGFQWNIMGGKLPWRMMAGGGLQGELGRFGVRAEANVNFPQSGYAAGFGARDTGTYVQASGGVDIRFDNSLHLFFEYLFRGNGFAEYVDYLASVIAAGTVRETYSARNYAALAATYEWHPLLTTQGFGLINLDDRSVLMSLMATYSMSDEADLVFGAYYPLGDEPKSRYGMAVPRSQYGTADGVAYLELRFYI